MKGEYFIEHQQSGVSVCLFYDNFRKSRRRKFVFGISRDNTGQIRIWRSHGQGQGHRSKKTL